MVKRELRDAERVYVNGILQNGTRIREQQAIMEGCAQHIRVMVHLPFE